MVGRISAGVICLRVRGRDCLKYLKVGGTEKRGGETKILKRGGKLGQRVGPLKKEGWNPLIKRTISKTSELGSRKY